MPSKPQAWKFCSLWRLTSSFGSYHSIKSEHSPRVSDLFHALKMSGLVPTPSYHHDSVLQTKQVTLLTWSSWWLFSGCKSSSASEHTGACRESQVLFFHGCHWPHWDVSCTGPELHPDVWSITKVDKLCRQSSWGFCNLPCQLCYRHFHSYYISKQTSELLLGHTKIAEVVFSHEDQLIKYALQKN